MTGIEAQTNAANYMPQAQMGISNTAMQTNLAMRGLREGVANAGYQIGMAQNQQVPQPSQFGTGIQRGIAGAGTGFAVGGGWGALAGGALGFASSYME
jgi:hypothetical protein